MWRADSQGMRPDSQEQPQAKLPFHVLLAACTSVFVLLFVLIWGIVLTFGRGGHGTSPFGPAVIMLSIAGLFWLFAWARRHGQTYGDEPAPHGGRTPRWYIRVPILAAYLYFELILAITHTWLALLFLVPFAIAAHSIYRRDLRRPVGSPFGSRDSPQERVPLRTASGSMRSSTA
jgi:hypothetical protein